MLSLQASLLLKKIKFEENHCNGCDNILENNTRIHFMIWMIFKNNSKYKVLSELYLQYVQKIIHREDVVLDKSGVIDVDKYLNYYK